MGNFPRARKCCWRPLLQRFAAPAKKNATRRRKFSKKGAKRCFLSTQGGCGIRCLFSVAKCRFAITDPGMWCQRTANRRKDDVAVLGILSSSVPALAALSNRTWMFEQPAPFTYPVFRPDAQGGLKRIDPLVRSEADLREVSRFREAGHYTHAADKLFADAFLNILRDHQALPWRPVRMSDRPAPCRE